MSQCKYCGEEICRKENQRRDKMERLISEEMYDNAVKSAMEEILEKDEFKDKGMGVLMFMLTGSVMANMVRTELFGEAGDEEDTAAERKAEKPALNSLEHLTFGQALESAKFGAKISRRGWNGEGQYVVLGNAFKFGTIRDNKLYGCLATADHKDIGGQALVFVGTRGVQVGWLASQADMLANDWYILKD